MLVLRIDSDVSSNQLAKEHYLLVIRSGYNLYNKHVVVPGVVFASTGARRYGHFDVCDSHVGGSALDGRNFSLCWIMVQDKNMLVRVTR